MVTVTTKGWLTYVGWVGDTLTFTRLPDYVRFTSPPLYLLVCGLVGSYIPGKVYGISFYTCVQNVKLCLSHTCDIVSLTKPL